VAASLECGFAQEIESGAWLKPTLLHLVDASECSSIRAVIARKSLNDFGKSCRLRAFVAQRTDPDTRNVEAPHTMRRKASLPGQLPRHASSTDRRVPVPLEVFYVVQTTGDVIGRRHHRVCPPLYETRHQARIELMHLQAASTGCGTLSIWKAATYVEPAEWLYDVVIADGSIVRLRDHHQRRIDRVAAAG